MRVSPARSRAFRSSRPLLSLPLVLTPMLTKKVGSRKIEKGRGRPAGPSAATLARGLCVRSARAGGIPGEAILGGMEPKLVPSSGSSRERHRHVRRTLDRWEQPVRLGAAPANPKGRQRAAYAARAVGNTWIGVTQEPEWN